MQVHFAKCPGMGLFFPIHKLSCQRAGAEGVVLVNLVFVLFVPLVSELAFGRGKFNCASRA
jgi:hypothetical protein